VSKLENAQEWLEKAANELWSTEKLMAEIQQFKSNQQQGLEQDLKNRVFLVESDQQQPGTISIVYNPVNKIDEVSLNTTIKQIIKKILEKEDNLKEKNEIK
jgi:S-adenosylmethionine synthetase